MRCRPAATTTSKRPTPELYDVLADPQEKNNLAPQQTATVAVLEDKLQSLLRQNPFKPAEKRKLGAESRRSGKTARAGLRRLSLAGFSGGVGGGPARSQEQTVGIQCNSGSRRRISLPATFQAGETLLAQVQEKDPQMYIVPFMLGEAAARQQKWEEAVDCISEMSAVESEFRPGHDRTFACPDVFGKRPTKPHSGHETR